MNLKSMTLGEMTQLFKDMGQPAFRAKQVYTWLHRGVRSYEEMTNLPKPLRERLAAEYPIYAPKVVRKQESQRDGTIKYLWQLSDGNCVETVLMRYHYGNTVCISTEVGCRMGCAFCASTLGGLVRRLEPFEMLDQVLFTQVDSGQPISHIVLMGIGEPLDDFDNVMRFLELVNSPEGMNISMRHISLSTCGLVPKIDELAKRNLQLTLSVSLHAPNDAVRDTIMPVNKAYPSQELIDACRRYYEATSRRISFEYAMIQGGQRQPGECQRASAADEGAALPLQSDPPEPCGGEPLKAQLPGERSGLSEVPGGRGNSGHGPQDPGRRHRCQLRAAAQKVYKRTEIKRGAKPCKAGA